MLVTRKDRAPFVLLQLACDMVAVVAGLLVGYWVRFHAELIPPQGGWEGEDYIRQFPWALGLWLVALYLTGNYQNHPKVITYNRSRRLLKASLLAIVLIIAKNYFMRDRDLARILYPIIVVTVTASLLACRMLLQLAIIEYYKRHRAAPRSRVLIIGLGPTALRLAARIRMHPEYAYELAGFISANGGRTGQRIGGVPVLGRIEDLREVLRTHSIQDVFIAGAEMARESILELFLEEELASVRAHVIPSLAEMLRSRIFYDEIAGVPTYHILESPLTRYNIALKRAFDVAVSAVALLALSPVMAAIAVAVRRSSPGPAIYRQKRLSLQGTEFTLYKFRTMPVHAERDGPGWGSQDDPRATRTGRFLRRWNLDELPQLWNVLRGDMSLVGPRPERRIYVDHFKERIPLYMTRHKVRTGMTGWAQVHGLRGDTSIAQRLRYDLYYIENWSLWLDMKIILMTFFRRPRHRRAVTPLPVAAPTPEKRSEESECPTADTKPALSTTKQPG